MEEVKYKKYTKACDLPDDWDILTKENIYLSKSFLSFIERTEKDYYPTYHLFYKGDKADSCFLSHPRKNYNLTMFTKLNTPINVTFIYLPMSVTASSLVLGELKEEVFKKIKSIKGYKMTLNMPFNNIDGFAVGLTCPKCILHLNFVSFEDYTSKLRSNYRFKLNKVMKKSKPLQLRFIDNRTEFTNELYAMYKNVLNRSRLRIETLSKEYFSGEMFKIFTLELNGKPVGFTQLLENGEELIFEFVGVDYKYNEEFSVYHRMLYEIIKYGIENGFKQIDFGQTADDTKLKLGCHYQTLYAVLHHSNPIINWVCKKVAPIIDYKPITTKFNVFKDFEEK